MLTKNLSVIGRHWHWYSRSLTEKYQMQGPDLSVLSFLDSQGQAIQDAVCKLLLLDKATMAKSAFRLEEMEFISRQINQKDRREKILCVTTRGKEICREIKEERRRWESICLDGFSEDEIQQFLQLSDRAMHNALNYRKSREEI